MEMELSVSVEDSQSTTATSCSPGYKRMTLWSEGKYDKRRVLSASVPDRNELKRRKTSSALTCFDPFALPDLSKGETGSIYGSAAKAMAAIHARRMEVFGPSHKIHMTPLDTVMDMEKGPSVEVAPVLEQKKSNSSSNDVTILEDKLSGGLAASVPTIINLDSDEEDSVDQSACHMHQEIIFEKSDNEPHRGNLMVTSSIPSVSSFKAVDVKSQTGEGINVRVCDENKALIENCSSLATEIQATNDMGVNMTSSLERKHDNLISATMVEKERDKMIIDLTEGDEENDISTTTVQKDMSVKITGCNEKEPDSDNLASVATCPEVEVAKVGDRGVYVGVKEEMDFPKGDELDDIWKEARTAIEFSKEIILDQASYESSEEDCDHQFILKDDIGDVCRVCGLVKRNIENIFDFMYKVNRSSRTYMRSPQKNMNNESTRVLLNKLDLTENEPTSTELNPHPRHSKVMKSHQIEGFNFLVRNLITQDPGGCILAHAPGSGKTFMMICFIQIFLTRYPHARVLVVLPKGILPTWKKEFETWKVEDVPLHDFYTARAENRSQQLDVLNEWVGKRSILFLGYAQFSNIVCDTGKSKAASACKKTLLEAPDILILDEGHTSRNDETALFNSLAKIKTPRRVILSGTLYQNHVREVFNILNLVRPRFLKLDAPSAIMNRLMSRIERKNSYGDAFSSFYDSVENTLQQDGNLRTKTCVIQDLREMTDQVLHYYKGDFLDDLPGLLDFTVLLNLSTEQKHAVQKIKRLEYIRRASEGSLVYVHHQLKSFSEKIPPMSKSNSFAIDESIDEMLKKIEDIYEGAKARFFLNMLRFCESNGEKLLVFSQFLLPLKFLERLAVSKRGWSVGKELFMISGESSSNHRERSMDQFNNSPDAKILFGSIKACGEGISLVGASRILILDVHVNPSVTRQALGRAFRPGQTRKVYTYRLVAADSPEEEDHLTCFKKETISKMWFEYNDSMNQDFTIKTADANSCGDQFLESSLFNNDIKVLYKR